MRYDWELLLRLLREVQQSANHSFKPRRYAEEHALELEGRGEPMPNLDSLRAEAADYESILFEGGFMVARPEEEGGTGENFVLTERGQRLLEILDGRHPQSAGLRQRLDDQGAAALVPETFDGLLARP
ncbi:transcriptional regulator [Pseudomonas oligotrophica]|uniref:transcriptional regulator n=1 Tax=Pseudomonas oligotrophica TaxID=2912055 RepID=UPI001F3E05F3|nr:transcriptional regulator [Pseudomonas oligotrophica]MCF7203108.1 transcriptional regulator [Pseudomonas oligotrophica]